MGSLVKMRRRGRTMVLMGAALVASVGLIGTACSSDSEGGSSDDAVKAAWIYVGPINDGGWTTAHNKGREYVESELGGRVSTTYKENVPEGPEVTQVIDDLVKDGNTIIFGTSYGFKDQMVAAASKYPDVKFEMATGDDMTLGKTVPSNYNEYWGAGEDTLYLSGIAAGSATTNNTIGVIAPFAIPEVIRHINAFTLGAQSVNPAITVKVVWTKTWFDPAKERQAAESLVSSGVGAIFSHQDGPAAGEVAKGANLPWVGYDSDQSANYPSVWLTTATYDWGPYYLSKVDAVIDGTWTQDNYYGTIADNFTSLASFGSLVDQPTRDRIAAALAVAKQGSARAFGWYWGLEPRSDQSGAVRITQGQTLTMEDLYTMNYFVAGIDGNPQG